VTVAQELWDAEAWHTLASRREQFARDTGALVQLQFALHALAWSHILAGQLNEAGVLIEEDRMLAAATGNAPLSYTDILLAAFRGEDARASEAFAAAGREAAGRGLGRVVNFAAYAGAVLSNGLERHAEARDLARGAFERDHAGYGPFIVPELAEAAARTGDVELLPSALGWITDRTRETPSDWSLGIEARIRALMDDGADADGFYRASIESSPQTVEWHLRKVFGKLGISSRRELRQVLPSGEPEAAPA
jgi:hypothetical protein